MTKAKAYYTAMIIVLPISIIFFGTAIIGVLIEELGILIQKPGDRYKKELIRIAKEISK